VRKRKDQGGRNWVSHGFQGFRERYTTNLTDSFGKRGAMNLLAVFFDSVRHELLREKLVSISEAKSSAGHRRFSDRLAAWKT
jgi:hypothetical protein